MSFIFTHALGKIVDAEDFAGVSCSWVDEWLLGKLIAGALRDAEVEEGQAWYAVSAVKMLIACLDLPGAGAEPDAAVEESSAYRVLYRALQIHEVQTYLGVNRHQGILWFNKEAFDHWLWWLMLTHTLNLLQTGATDETLCEGVVAFYGIIEQLREAELQSGYQVPQLLEGVKR